MKTATRPAYKARPNIPKFFQPKVKPDVALTCKVVHWDLITDMLYGKSTAFALEHWMEAGLTYLQMMRLLADDGEKFTPESYADMDALMKLIPVVVDRHNLTKHVYLNETELVIARAGANLMDQLISMDRHGIAWSARQWSDAQILRINAKGKNK